MSRSIFASTSHRFSVLGMAVCQAGANTKLLLIMRLTAGRGHVIRILPGALAHLNFRPSSSSSGSLGWISLRTGPMLASNLHLRVHWSRDRGRQPQESPHLMVVLVVILALVNVSATMLMAGSWASLSNGMLELERSIQDRPAEIVN